MGIYESKCAEQQKKLLNTGNVMDIGRRHGKSYWRGQEEEIEGGKGILIMYDTLFKLRE